MKFSVSSYSFSQYRAKTKCDYTEICRLAKEMGYEGIEFVDLDSVATAERIKKYCDEIGLPIVAYAVGADFARLFPSKTVKKLKKQVDIAAALGAPVMRHDVCYSLGFFRDTKKAAQRMAPFIREVTEYALSKGIKTCTENHGFIFQAPDRVKYLIDCVGHENYRWLCDVGNFLCVGADPLSSVKVAAPYAVHVHAKDFFISDTPKPNYFRTADGKYLCGTIIGKGVVPVKDCLAVLAQNGYDGFVSVEFEGKEDNLYALREAIAYLKNN